MRNNRITLRSLLVGSIFSALFAALAIYVNNHVRILFSATQISVLPYLLLILMVLLLNPLLRLIRVIRAFSLVELMIIFIMSMISAGIPNFGLVEQIVPLAGSMFSREWNNPQSEWNRHLVPFINDAYFVSVPGMRDTAAEYYGLVDEIAGLESARYAAERALDRRAEAAEIQGKLNRLESAGQAADRTHKIELRRTRLVLETLRGKVAAAEGSWSDFAALGHPEMDVVLRDYPEIIAEKSRESEQALERLSEIEKVAFAKVELFRRGLPRDLSAYPGIFPLPQDDWQSYSGRLGRLRQGRVAVKALQEARDMPVPDNSRAADLVEQAEQTMGPLGDSTVPETRLDAIAIEEAVFLAEHKELEERLLELNTVRRKANRSKALALEGDIAELSDKLHALDKHRQALRQTRERCTRELDCAARIRNLTAELAGLREALESNAIDSGELRSVINGLMPEFAAVDVSLRRYFIGEIPWSHWARPLGRWALLILLSYVALMSLNVLIFRQWAHNEMITYPLAELPKALVYTDRPEGGLPDVFRNGMFWLGVGLAGAVLGWNLLCKSQVVPGLSPFNLANSWGSYLGNTPLQVLMGWKSEIFFTMIGLAFLIPKNISFSLWFFYLAYMVQLLIMYWSGHIDNEGTAQWWYLSNIKYAEGGGAMLVFASVVLFKCRRYILCAFRPDAIKELEADERRELRISSWAFIGASLGIILQLWLDMGANLFYTIFFYIVTLFVVIAMVRAVAEGGLLAVKTYINPFHVLRAFFGFNKSWTAVPLFTPLMLYCGILFLDLKVFIAPAMANALKLRNDFRMRRGVFHLAVALAIVLAAVVATITSIMMSYDRGADNMSPWFYNGWPRGTFNTLTTITRNPPDASMSSALWMSVGAVVTGLIIYARQFFFWVPHPLGLVMLVNPIMQSYWFSIFLGWLANSAITKYGHKNTYVKASGFFIGLIVGELLIVMLSVAVSLATGNNIVIDLNRN